ncbi:MAG: hypothetical protein DWQ34_15185 [Planctomycetota bacterium]|nr:MAG: hypothetical protein DWQ34_15185 [Planctomycetota bacterium]REK31283.1 MAG: hypothetical protein DWQ41_00050 [Planctomycetota bacterium]REK37313.1 MAG: hypothetical protein DWQ45_07655 [Planctomycetota bacterium]
MPFHQFPVDAAEEFSMRNLIRPAVITLTVALAATAHGDDPLGGLNPLGGPVGGGGGAQGGAGLGLPGLPGVRGVDIGPSLDVGANAGVDANLSTNPRLLNASGSVRSSAEMRARFRRTSRPDERTPGEESPQNRPTASDPQSASPENRALLQLDLYLANRLSQIDRLRDYAIAHNDVSLLIRADSLESEARALHQQQVTALTDGEASQADDEWGPRNRTGVWADADAAGAFAAESTGPQGETSADVPQRPSANSEFTGDAAAWVRYRQQLAAEAAQSARGRVDAIQQTSGEFATDAAAGTFQRGDVAADSAARQAYRAEGRFRSMTRYQSETTGPGAADQAAARARGNASTYLRDIQGQTETGGYGTGRFAPDVPQEFDPSGQPIGVGAYGEGAVQGRGEFSAPEGAFDASGRARGAAGARTNLPSVGGVPDASAQGRLRGATQTQSNTQLPAGSGASRVRGSTDAAARGNAGAVRPSETAPDAPNESAASANDR